MKCHLLIAALLATSAFARPDHDDEGCWAEQVSQGTARQVTSMDEATGRDALSYPQSPVADFQHMSLKLVIPDMNTPRMEALQMLTFAAVGKPLAALSLDAHLFDVKAVSLAKPSKTKVSYKHDGRTLALTFDPPLPVGEKAELVTAYVVGDTPQGLTWTPESTAWPGRPAQLHSQGQAESNSYWFPCHDSPNERLTTELTVTVPDGFVASSNGRLVETLRPTPGGPVTFHWLQDKPHVNYLVTLVVGKFDVESVSGKGQVPMPVYVPPGRGKDIKRTYGNTSRMVDVFTRRTGQPYPWDQYAQLVVWNFSAGGMENTSATTMYDTAILSPEGLADGDLDGLISHELAHQWFGDLITSKSWEHIWLNEGFATYMSNLWFEERDGQNGYEAGVIRNFDSVIAADKADAPYQAAMVSKDFRNPGDAFRKPANPYPKGSSILHMLRRRLGDEVFFKALAAYVDKYKFGLVETADFRRSMEDASGESLERFFTQWCYHPGVPDLDIACDWKADTGELTVTVEQRQNIDGYNPAFAFSLPVWVETRAKGKPSVIGAVEVTEKSTTAKFKLPGEPTIVAIDPGMHVLAKMTIRQPLTRWLSQLERGPSLGSRVQAARALGAHATNLAGRSLVKVAEDAKAPDILRRSCIASLATRWDAASLAELVRARLKDRDAREELVEAVVKVLGAASQAPEAPRLSEFLATTAAKDDSFRVRAAALRALGRLKMTDQFAILAAAAGVESQHDRVRQGALEGLGLLDAPEGLALAIEHAQVGTYSRTRPVAIEAIGRLAHHNPNTAVPALCRLAADRERRTWQAAGEALARLGDKRAVPPLKAVMDSKRDPADKELFQRWINAAAPTSAASAAKAPVFVRADADAAWYPIAKLDDWATTGAERAEVEADAAAFFSRRGYIAERQSKGVYMLCWDRPESRMTASEGDWAVTAVEAREPGLKIPVFIKFDATGSKKLGELSERNVGRRLAVLVEDRVYMAPNLMTRISTEAAITGTFSTDEVAAVRNALLNERGLSFRITVNPGERKDESSLREQFRKPASK